MFQCFRKIYSLADCYLDRIKDPTFKLFFLYLGKFEGGRKWRTDHRCGKEFPLSDGSGPSECNPRSKKYYCCSKYGFCGGPNKSNPIEDHCNGGVNYKNMYNL